MKKTIHWFRQDLRVADNPAWVSACESGAVFPVYIHDTENGRDEQLGAASEWWLHHSLESLNKSLGGALNIYAGDSAEIIHQLVRKYDISGVTWNGCYEPWRVELDRAVTDLLEKEGIEVAVFNGSLLWAPEEVSKQDGTPYKVFTPFFKRGCLGAMPPRRPLPEPKGRYGRDPESVELKELDLLPKQGWDAAFYDHWKPGETGAFQRLESFLALGLKGYKEGRDFPARKNVSRLSPHLHFGEISPNQIWYAVRNRTADDDVGHFCSELGWREFSNHLLFHFPYITKRNLNPKFDVFPWDPDEKKLQAWQQGKTGIPIVDAGMRELWQTGYMHNRVRMVAASFLVKNLLIHWKEGERWFRDTLVDADLANNTASWQWVAGSGADAAPYFRIFNAVTQGRKFDSDGAYIRSYIPEISRLPDKYLFSPWEAPENILREAGVVMGSDYPLPIADLKKSRADALAAYATIKEGGTSSA
ncbi:cryptochrome/photolyase family protein [Pontiella agarivorans]|uniref:Deoxyribodipyrimidine photo-lyase n=1 Tax=Pontiella agarivorans TaxID=3038953 RepID=A0ABU5MZ25_9BACT|nr:deoxyribodipyrimidine photo-lyase [Pontiella agarivorans]MDZ8119216.1 deoxyribodipyrimidine photo-lyase [Pontiella agarivorans]